MRALLRIAIVAVVPLATSSTARAGGFLADVLQQAAQVRDVTLSEKVTGVVSTSALPKYVPLPGANGLPSNVTASVPSGAVPIAGGVSGASSAAPASSPSHALGAPPTAVLNTVSKQTPAQRSAVAADISKQIAALQTQASQLIAERPRSTTFDSQLNALNESISSKKQALLISQGGTGPVSVAAVESYAATVNPYFLMCQDQFWAPTDSLDWHAKIVPLAPKLTAIGRSVGLVTLSDRPAGTATVIGTHLILTNLHVLKLIADFDGSTWTVKDNAQITFDKEIALGAPAKCPTANVSKTYFINAVFATPKNSDDLAILITSSDSQFPAGIKFVPRDNNAYQGNMIVAVIGYPGPPEDMTVAEQIQFFHTPTVKVPVFGYKRLSEGFTGTDPVSPDGYFVHKANTAGGNSGSPIVDLETGDVVGIHVMGVDRFQDSMGYNEALVSERVIDLLKTAGLQ